MPARQVASVGSTDETESTTFHIRGHEYVVSEIPAEDYEEALRSAAVVDEESGKPTDKTDMLLFERLLAVEAVKRDGAQMELEVWNKLPYPITKRLSDEIKRLHWLDLETDEEKAAREKAAKERAKKDDKAKAAESDVPNS